MATLEELVRPLTRREIEAAIYQALARRGVTTTTWKPGAVVRTIVTATSVMLSALSALQAEVAKGGFLAFSKGAWLEVLAREGYGVDKSEGTFASTIVELVNGGGGVYSVDAGDLLVKSSRTGKTYRSTGAVSLGVSERAFVRVVATELGSGSSAEAGEIDAFETPLVGVTVRNIVPAIGQDAESDAQLQDRCSAKLGSLSPNGPRDAYRFAAFSAQTENGESAGITRVGASTDGTGRMDVVIATASGLAAGEVGNLTTPLGAVDEAIQTQVVPDGVTAVVRSARPKAIAIGYAVWLRPSVGLTVAELGEGVSAALTAYLATQPIGGSRKVSRGPGFVYVDALGAVIAEAMGLAHLIDLDLIEPAADVLCEADEAPVLGGLSANITVVG